MSNHPSACLFPRFSFQFKYSLSLGALQRSQNQNQTPEQKWREMCLWGSDQRAEDSNKKVLYHGEDEIKENGKIQNWEGDQNKPKPKLKTRIMRKWIKNTDTEQDPDPNKTINQHQTNLNLAKKKKNHFTRNDFFKSFLLISWLLWLSSRV